MKLTSLRSRLALVVLPLMAACSSSVDDGPQTAESQDTALTSDAAPVALRYARLSPSSSWAFVIEVKNRFFEERVAVAHRTPGGAWQEVDGTFLRSIDSSRALYLVQGISALTPLEFAVHRAVVFSGGTGLDFWDNNGGANYRCEAVAPGVIPESPMGSGVDVAVTDVSANGTDLDVTIVVRNVAPGKQVDVLATTDDWKTTTLTRASYAGAGDHAPGRGERWQLHTSFDAKATRVQLAAVARQAGREAWDNDLGNNFDCHLDPASKKWGCVGATLIGQP